MGNNLQPHARIESDSIESISFMNEVLQGGDMVIANIIDGDTYLCEWTNDANADFIFEADILHLSDSEGKFHEKTGKFAKELGEESVVISFPGTTTNRKVYYQE